MAPLSLGFQSGEQTQLETTGEDFLLPGTQPNSNPYQFIPIYSSNSCGFCHADFDVESAPMDTWISSAKAQSARDPIWHAALAIANQDAATSGQFCIRCHSPAAWLGERATDGTVDQFYPEDFDGVTCHFCHRMVNPVLGPDSAIGYPENPDPTPDPEVLQPLEKQGLLPIGPGSGQYIVDPRDVRRGPFDDVPDNLHGLSEWGEQVDLVHSPFHTRSEFCGTCHDVSNPVFTRLENGSYAVGQLNAPHPSFDPKEMFPEQRTYSEWANSEFATVGVFFPDGRFGGANTGPMHSCQDCHMPDQVGGGCAFYEYPPFFARTNVPQHGFAGANHWMVEAVAASLGPDAESIGLTADRVQAAKARSIQMLRDASDLELTSAGNQLVARVINQSGHKLPTGYPEGRRMWLHVKFYDAGNQLLAEHGAYDYDQAELLDLDTKIYETKHGIDETVAQATGLPVGPNFHLALANKRYFDNRIPPRGFTNAAFQEARCEPVGYEYADGQYWDDTTFDIPPGATLAVVSLLHEVTTREYAEFLRDTNVTNDAGETAYALWEQFGRAALVEMDSAQLELGPACGEADFNCDGVVNGDDLGTLLGEWGLCPGCQADLNDDGRVDGNDLGTLLGLWG